VRKTQEQQEEQRVRKNRESGKIESQEKGAAGRALVHRERIIAKSVRHPPSVFIKESAAILTCHFAVV
jgi:hypothetical protein